MAERAAGPITAPSTRMSENQVITLPKRNARLLNVSSMALAPAGTGTVISVQSPRSTRAGAPSTVACQSGYQFSATRA